MDAPAGRLPKDRRDSRQSKGNIIAKPLVKKQLTSAHVPSNMNLPLSYNQNGMEAKPTSANTVLTTGGKLRRAYFLAANAPQMLTDTSRRVHTI